MKKITDLLSLEETPCLLSVTISLLTGLLLVVRSSWLWQQNIVDQFSWHTAGSAKELIEQTVMEEHHNSILKLAVSAVSIDLKGKYVKLASLMFPQLPHCNRILI